MSPFLASLFILPSLCVADRARLSKLPGGVGGDSWRRHQRNMDLFTILSLYGPYERLISPTPLSPLGRPRIWARAHTQSYMICVLGVRTPCGDTPALLHENAPSPNRHDIMPRQYFSQTFWWIFFARVKKYVRDMSSCKIDGWRRRRMGDKNHI